MVMLEMLVDGLPEFQTDFKPVDYAAVARAIASVGSGSKTRKTFGTACARGCPIQDRCSSTSRPTPTRFRCRLTSRSRR